MRVVRHVLAAQQAGVVDGGRDDRDVPLGGEAQHPLGTILLEERQPSRAHHDVDIRLLDEVGEHLALVHSGAEARDDALVAQLGERLRAGRRRGLPVIVGVVHVDDVDAVDAEPLEAVLDRAQHPVAAEVVHPAGVGRHVEAVREVALVRGLGTRHQHAPDLRGQDVLVARVRGQRAPEAALREPEAVVRRGVEIADAALPRRADGLPPPRRRTSPGRGFRAGRIRRRAR